MAKKPTPKKKSAAKAPKSAASTKSPVKSKSNPAKSTSKPAKTAKAKAPSIKSKSAPPAVAPKTSPKPAKPAKNKAGHPVRVPRPVSGGTLYSEQKAQMHKAEQEHAPVALTEDDLRKCKSGLNKKDLDHYMELLLEKRAEILGDVDSIQRDQKSNQGGNLSNMPLHMADIGTENYDQEFNLSLVESERRLLHEIVEAIMRIRQGFYGVCMETGKPIGKPRLDAKPWARFCIEVARDRERRGEKVF